MKFGPGNKECVNCLAHISGVPITGQIRASLDTLCSLLFPLPLKSLLKPGKLLKKVISGSTCLK